MFKRATFRKRPASVALAWVGLGLLLGSVGWWQALPDAPARDDLTVTAETNGDVGGIVVIDAGHGGQDSGTVHNGIMEKDLALDIARRVDRLFRARKISTRLTRNGDYYVSLASRVASANQEPEAVFVSIHFDEAQATAAGVETYYAAHQVPRQPTLVSWLPFWRAATAEPANLESQNLAGAVQEALIANTQAANRGTRAQQFYVIANVRHPAVLVEGGFLTNKNDVSKLTTDQYREELAAAIVEGVLRYRGRVRQPPAGIPSA